MIRGYRRDISDDKEENVYKDTNKDNWKNVYKSVKENISGYDREDVYRKIYVRECHAEGTGYEPPGQTARLDTPVIVY